MRSTGKTQKKTLGISLGLVLSFGLALWLLSTTIAVAEEQEGLVEFKSMKPALALQLAQATLDACREAGYQVAVAVVDRSGITQVILRDQLAGAHTPETARRKAWTAASFNTPTTVMMDVTQSGKEQSGVRFVAGALMIGGGIPISAAGSLVGAVGVSGAPGGDLDHNCGQAGIDAIEESLLF
ncbi:MAG: heme-binding protein [Ectothiorhodospiraceae bacterium]|nr:heme-binding protein [Ectothiorhodospiraceae bacterium]